MSISVNSSVNWNIIEKLLKTYKCSVTKITLYCIVVFNKNWKWFTFSNIVHLLIPINSTSTQNKLFFFFLNIWLTWTASIVITIIYIYIHIKNLLPQPSILKKRIDSQCTLFIRTAEIYFHKCFSVTFKTSNNLIHPSIWNGICHIYFFFHFQFFLLFLLLLFLCIFLMFSFVFICLCFICFSFVYVKIDFKAFCINE